MNLVEELVGLIDVLQEADIEYAICGGIAVAIHGYPRFTKDIDILVRAEDLARVRAVVGRVGFSIEGGLLRFGQDTPNERSVYRVSKSDGNELLTLDLLISSPALHEAWSGRERIEWRGRKLDVVSREGLVRMKRLAGRTQDLLDIEKLSEEAQDG